MTRKHTQKHGKANKTKPPAAAKAEPRAKSTSDIMPFKELLKRLPIGRARLYNDLKAGVYPTIKSGSRVLILRAPTERILRGDQPPGGPPASATNSPRRAVASA